MLSFYIFNLTRIEPVTRNLALHAPRYALCAMRDFGTAAQQHLLTQHS
jgi:hypothetical protein